MSLEGRQREARIDSYRRREKPRADEIEHSEYYAEEPVVFVNEYGTEVVHEGFMAWALNSNATNSLLACPVCGIPFPAEKSPATHLLNDHKPEDFGLTPMGESDCSEGDDLDYDPMIDPVEEMPEGTAP